MAFRFLSSLSPAKARWLLCIAGAVILLSGYTGAALIFRAEDRLDQAAQAVNDNEPLSLRDSRTATRQAELLYGKSALMMDGVLEWAGSFTHGRPLAKSLIVLSSAAALGCFLAANRRTL